MPDLESSREGMVTSRDGSGISSPRLSSASNAELHSVPKWMLWWAAEEAAGRVRRHARPPPRANNGRAARLAADEDH